ncbi:DUF2125 domain-containing protein [Ruegeria sp. 2205SS24-7]|uniref:DUF2125 domain-containing protein n=1 Tax=Ruegeria discodermiae TaxID=3064389 RepID=UPI002741F2AF|nr:DUF2125 domain-containing protein [Ruegeria sp. 2205SS24-7]MDP5219259.1 DUF2125 domain-containing protein [Ruegeria sp. 2205SS24-7]
MRRLLKLAIVVIVLWSGYWLAAAYGLRSSVEAWFAAQAERGWQADYAEISTAGYPLRHKTTLTSPALADPRTGAAWQADWIMFDSPAIWPGRQTLRFADTPQRLSYFDQTAVVTAQDLTADLHLHPGVRLELQRMALTAGPWRIDTVNGTALQADTMSLAMAQEAQPETYMFGISAEGFTPGDALRRLLRSDSALPRSLDTLELDVAVRFDKPWDRSALEENRPQPQMIDLRLAEMRWGELRLFATGELEVDGQGIPTGEVALKAENWQEMLAMAQAAGAIPEQAVGPANRVLGMLAGLGGNRNSLDVQLNFRDGFVALGPIPLGPAPRLILR